MKAGRVLIACLVTAVLAGCGQRAHSARPPGPGDVQAVSSSSAAARPQTTEQPRHPPFQYTIQPLPPWLKQQMRTNKTWHRGCPVPMRDLRYLTLRYWDFDHNLQTGPMVVNKAAAKPFTTVFRKLYLANFPINKMHLATYFDPNKKQNPYDKRDWTTAFNCRVTNTARGAGTNWSMHAYGLAVDINPMQNPYVTKSGYIFDVYARKYRNRHQHLPGMIHAGDVVVQAFEAIGWHWAGYWSGDKDYMHFSSNGR